VGGRIIRFDTRKCLALAGHSHVKTGFVRRGIRGAMVLCAWFLCIVSVVLLQVGWIGSWCLIQLSHDVQLELQLFHQDMGRAFD